MAQFQARATGLCASLRVMFFFGPENSSVCLPGSKGRRPALAEVDVDLNVTARIAALGYMNDGPKKSFDSTKQQLVSLVYRNRSIVETARGLTAGQPGQSAPGGKAKNKAGFRGSE